ncbi:hypothetical protein BK721_27355 [Bacillus thuringiensis serovar nigeriensis]|nr:hypothetical protein BK721_27355 [Bacillus thuringiensis serovar nigeriensis]
MVWANNQWGMNIPLLIKVSLYTYYKRHILFHKGICRFFFILTNLLLFFFLFRACKEAFISHK